MNDEWKHKIFARDRYKCVYCGWDGRMYLLQDESTGAAP